MTIKHHAVGVREEMREGKRGIGIMGGRRDGEMTVDLWSTILCKFSSMPP
jgi:hypothetical protein